MKKRLISCVIVLALALSLAALPAAAAAFPDIETHWAKDNIEQMAEQGLFKGYEDGTFRPDHLMLTSEALALCARIAVSDTLRAQIGKDRAAELDGLLQGSLSWFRDDFATCLEVGILTHAELSSILLSGQDQVPMQKAEFARYLTRAIGLEAKAQEQKSIGLSYADADMVPVPLQPYIYIMTLHGVLNGTEHNEIRPLDYLTRAVAATMIGRALEAREVLEVSIELPRYSNEPWTAGYIADVTAGSDGATLITVDGMLGRHTVNLPFEGMIYLDNLPARRSDLEIGAYARLILNDDGKADVVRLIDAEQLEKDSGPITTLAGETLVLDHRVYSVNRFTAFTIGGKTGDWSIVDLDVDYTTAECVTDGRDTLLSVKLMGGFEETFGLLSKVEISSVTGAVTMALTGFDGRVQRYLIPQDAPVTSGSVPYVLKADMSSGSYVTLRVSNEDPTKVVAVELDFVSKYMQGSLNTISANSFSASITELPGSRTGTYTIDPDCKVTLSGAPALLGSIKSGSFVTARLQGGQIVELSVWPGSVETTGKLVSLTYGDSTVLHVETENGMVEQFSIPLSELSDISITRSKATSNISQLSTGDTVTILVRFHRIVSIAATPQTADVTGTVQEISFNTSGASILLLLPDGATAVYNAAAGITVIQDGSVVPLSNIKPGVTLAIVTEGTRIISAEIQQIVLSNTKLEGQVYFREENGRRLTLIVDDGAGGTRLVVVNIPNSISTVMDTLEGPITVNKIVVGNTLQVWGAYDRQEFVATAVVRVR